MRNNRREPVTVLFLIDELRTAGGAEKIFVRLIELLPRDQFRPLAVTFKVDPSLTNASRFPLSAPGAAAAQDI